MEARKGELQKKLTKPMTGAILVATAAYAFVNSTTSVLINDIIDTFSLTGAAQGLLSSMMSMGMMLALIATPMLQGRVSKTAMMLMSGLLQAAMLFLSGAAASFALFVPAIVALGMGCGWLDTYVNSAMVDVHPTDGPKYLGLLHGLFGVGSLLAPMAMQWLLLGATWRGVHFIIAGLMLAAMAFMAKLHGDVRKAGGVEAVEEARLSRKEIGAYVKNGRNLLLLLCGAVTSMVQTGVICWIVRYMLLRYNLEEMGAVCLTVYWVAATVNRFLAPRLRARPLALVSIGAALGAVFLSGGIWSGSAPVMCIAVGLTGLVTGHFMPMMVSVCAEGHQGNTTLTTSVLMFISGAARVAVPLLMAAVTDGVSVNGGMMVPAALALVCALLAMLALRAGEAQ